MDIALLAVVCKSEKPLTGRMGFDKALLTRCLSRVTNGIKDNVEVYNIPKFDGFHGREQPAVLQNNIEAIEKFSRVSQRAH